MREKREIKHQHWQKYNEGERLLVNTSNMLGYNSCYYMHIAQILSI